MTLDVATIEATELLRTALLAKLAVDLQDPELARRAAREALAHARLLSGLDFPSNEDAGVHCGPRMPAVQDLLERVHPRLTDGDGEAA